jgi:hypothetical protein
MTNNNNNNNNNHNNNTESKKIERAAAIREQVAKQMTAAAAAVVSPNTISIYEYGSNDIAPATLFVTSWASRCLLLLAKIILQSSNMHKAHCSLPVYLVYPLPADVPTSQRSRRKQVKFERHCTS